MMTKNTILGIVILVLIILGVVVFLQRPVDLVNKNDNSQEKTSEQNQETSSPKTEETTNPQNPNVNININLDAASVKNVTVLGSNFKFNPNEIRVKKGERVKITFSSEGGMHDLKIDEFGVATKILRSGDAADIVEFTADKAGTFEYYCSVGNHRQMGMVGKLIVE